MELLEKSFGAEHIPSIFKNAPFWFRLLYPSEARPAESSGRAIKQFCQVWTQFARLQIENIN
jgi:hypothetical protein